MSETSTTLAVFVGFDHSPAADIARILGVGCRLLGIDHLENPPELSWAEDRVTWIHFVPALDQSSDELDEARALLGSARAAAKEGSRAGKPVTFIALMPSRGLLTGEPATSAELARGAFHALVRTEIGSWSARGDRLVGVVYAGLEGHELQGQRPGEAVRQRTPIGRLGDVDHLADVIRYLGSRSAGYVTGAVIHVDGGWNAYSWIYPARTI